MGKRRKAPLLGSYLVDGPGRGLLSPRDRHPGRTLKLWSTSGYPDCRSVPPRSYYTLPSEALSSSDGRLSATARLLGGLAAPKTTDYSKPGSVLALRLWSLL